MPTWKSKSGFTIMIDHEKCAGCLPCIENCPTKVFELINEKSVPKRIEDCTECCACVLICPEDAIRHSSC